MRYVVQRARGGEGLGMRGHRAAKTSSMQLIHQVNPATPFASHAEIFIGTAKFDTMQAFSSLACTRTALLHDTREPLARSYRLFSRRL
jgi:hypothetical protein